MLNNGAEGLVADHWCFFMHGSFPSEHFYLPSRDSRWMRRIHPIQIEMRTGCAASKFRRVVGSSNFFKAMGGEVTCGKEQRFKRSEQVAATRRWSVLLPQSVLRYTWQFWTMFHRAETPFLSDRHLISRSSQACCVA